MTAEDGHVVHDAPGADEAHAFLAQELAGLREIPGVGQGSAEQGNGVLLAEMDMAGGKLHRNGIALSRVGVRRGLGRDFVQHAGENFRQHVFYGLFVHVFSAARSKRP